MKTITVKLQTPLDARGPLGKVLMEIFYKAIQKAVPIGEDNEVLCDIELLDTAPGRTVGDLIKKGFVKLAPTGKGINRIDSVDNYSITGINFRMCREDE